MTKELIPGTGPGDAERRASGVLYGRNATEVAGRMEPAGDTVAYRRVLSPAAHRTLMGVAAVHIVLAVALTIYLVVPANLPRFGAVPAAGGIVMAAGLGLMIVLQLIVALRTWVLAYFAARAVDPVPIKPATGLRVAVLTTIVPGKEPVELVMATLRAMLRIRHDGPLDVWLLDEGDDPHVARLCAEIGVHHFSRKGHPEWNQDSGPFRRKTKHGNHNAWRSMHEADYDVVAQMDPDHVPYPNFLERTLGYFRDPDTAFVVAPQVYANLGDSFVARGAAELAYVFHGIMQRGGNGHAAPLLIGTNHLYRPAAFAQIGGYQDCIIEDHLTSMVVYAAVNPGTGNHWRGVYTPDILAVGEGPATYTDFFSQQKRWAYGIWEIARRHSPRLLPRLPRRGQRLAFFALQSHYPTTAASWVIGVALSAIYLVGGVSVTRLPALVWGVLFAANLTVGLGFFRITQRYNLVEHERRSWGLTGMALELMTAPIYVAAAAAQLAGRPLAYVVTAKGKAATGDTWRTFRPHLGWAAVAAACMTAGVVLHHDWWSLYLWTGISLLTCLAPLALLAADGIGRRVRSAAATITGRRRIGEQLIRQGLLSRQELEELLELQAGDGRGQRLGDLAVQHGYVPADRLI
ncbi:glycosyltransferase family 2 protein [Actinoplanes oblitus]|uniref:Glycosyltransferase family 2 protein n=1 Tax=Actinoplanes oblitus TaxID=3040509 RepID=A0ABY8WN53_9ACTN|nr:glycosyltransferase family 2 protein [Actinoplanes oblitus]WIM99291.1 glycosyltransferase family 2 protein [Actinoplanes oblitus]